MAIPWIETLPRAARLFLPIAQAGVTKGLSANSIIESYLKAGPGIRRKLGLSVIREVKSVKKKSDVFKYVRKTMLPGHDTIPTAPTKILKDYSYKVRYQGVMSDGRPFESFVTAITDKIIKPEEALDIALTMLNEMPSEYGIESVTDVFLEGIKKHPRFGYP